MTTRKIAMILTFDATQCVDVAPDQYDPNPDLQSICEYGAENFNLTDWEEVDSPAQGVSLTMSAAALRIVADTLRADAQSDFYEEFPEVKEACTQAAAQIEYAIAK